MSRSDASAKGAVLSFRQRRETGFSESLVDRVRETVRLTASTLETYVLGAPVTSHPQTVIDAKLVCRKLGFQYLWIDALCIIQDSQQDKAHEILRMGLIYSNAIITISTTSAIGVNDGFLTRRIRPEKLP